MSRRQPGPPAIQSGSPGEPTLLTTGEMARRSGTTLRTVRFYEAEGLIRANDREGGGHRRFTTSELARLQLISDMRGAGLSLAEVKSLIALQGRCSRPREAACQMTSRLQSQIDQLKTRIDTLKRVQSELVSTIDTLQVCFDCEHESFPECCETCEVTEQPDAQRVMHLLWKN